MSSDPARSHPAPLPGAPATGDRPLVTLRRDAPPPCPICGAALRRRFETAETTYRQCGSCRYLLPDLVGIDGLAVNQEIYSERFDARQADALAQDAKKKPKHQRLLRSFEPYRKLGRLLDLGCGAGTLLLGAAERGWQPIGVDPSMQRAATLDMGAVVIHPSALDACGFADASFDVVHANEVFEHVTDLGALVAEIARVLRPGGLLVARTPNHASWTVRLVGARWRHFGVVQNGHVGFLAPRTFAVLMRQHGLRPISIKTHYFSLRDRWRVEQPVVAGLLKLSYRVIGWLAVLCGRGERLTLRAERLTLRAERLTLRAERLTLRAERLTLRAERLTPQAERLTPQAERPTQQAERD